MLSYQVILLFRKPVRKPKLQACEAHLCNHEGGPMFIRAAASCPTTLPLPMMCHSAVFQIYLWNLPPPHCSVRGETATQVCRTFCVSVLWVVCILSSLIPFLCIAVLFQLACVSSRLDAVSSTIVVFYILTPVVTFEDETIKFRVNLNSSALRYCKIHNQLQENLRKIPII